MLQREKLESVFERKFKEDGDNYLALCPIHKESTPSFYIHKTENLVHCFGCGAKGNLVRFVEDYKGISQSEAEKLLGLTLEDKLDQWFKPPPAPTPPKIYPESWLAPFTFRWHNYFARRGLHARTLSHAEVRWDSERQRQVFPHRNREGKLVGAIGRSCNNAKPKWWFYWGYEKGRHLYTGGERKRLDTVWVVEGVLDALWLWQFGYSAVATLGSKPTKYQIDEIRDNYKDLIIAYDNDAAGYSGADKLQKELHTSCDIRIPKWPYKANDVMDTDPTKLELINVVQRYFISASG